MNDNRLLPGSPQPNIYGPLTPAQMFERTATLLRENPKLFFGIVAVVIGIELVVGGVLGGSGMVMRRSTVDAGPIMKAFIVLPLTLLGTFLIYIFTQIIQGALFLATRAKLEGAPTSVGDACRLAAEKTGRLVGISVLVGLRILGYLLLLDFAAGVLLVIVALAFGGFSHFAGTIPSHFGRGMSLGAVVFFGLFLLVLLFIYIWVFFWLVVRYSVAIPAALAENLSVTEAVRRSIHLTRGSKGRLIALFLAVAVVWILTFAVTLPLQLMAAHVGAAHVSLYPESFAVLGLASAAIKILISWATIAFVGVATALCYYDLRVRKESFGSAIPAPALEPPSVPLPYALDGPIEDLPIS